MQLGIYVIPGPQRNRRDDINNYFTNIGVVGQEPVLFRGTIHDNIAISSPDATREEVQRVAKIAYAHDFISRLPEAST